MSVDFYELKKQLPKGVIVLLNHGFKGDEDTFKDTCEIIFKKQGVLNAKVYLDDYLTSDATSDHNILRDLKNRRNIYLDKMVYIRTKFQDPKRGKLTSQASELKTMIDKIKQALGETASKYEFVLVGHSKGGLSNMRFTLDYPGVVNKIVSLNTPYNAPYDIDYNLWKDVDPQIEIEILNLGNEWNSLTSWPKVSAITTRVICTPGDTVVSVRSALGYPTRTKNLLWAFRKYKNFFSRTVIEGDFDSCSHIASHSNEKVIYAMILSIINMFNNTGEYYTAK